MSYLQTLYVWIAAGVAAAVGVVVLDSAPADVVAGLIVLIALAVVTRVVTRLADDGEQEVAAPRTHGGSSGGLSSRRSHL